MTDSPVPPIPVVLCALLDDARPVSPPSPADSAALADAPPGPSPLPAPAGGPPSSPPPPPSGVVIAWPGPVPPSSPGTPSVPPNPRGRIRLNAALLRRLRHQKLLSQQDLVDVFWRKNIRISIATIKRVESKPETMVRYRIAREFARYYEVPVETLLAQDA